MKNNRWKRLTAVCLACVLLCPILAGCGEEKTVVSIDRVKINDNGELIITYTDGSRDNLGVVVGKDGKDGQDGEDGFLTAEGSSTISAAATLGLRSTVSIYCTFTDGRPGSSSESDSYSAGSGVIYQLDKEKGNAFIITNYHVVYSNSSNTPNGICEDIGVYLYGSEMEAMRIPAQYVGGSMNYDIAVLYIEDSELLRKSDALAVTVADSDGVSAGQAAIAIGNAEGEGISVTSGIVSKDSEQLTMTAADDVTSVTFRVMRIDTPVNPGNSGGGLFNDAGELIGIVNAKIIDSDVENIGYAIPTSVAIGAAQNIIDYCFGTECESVQRPMLGVTIIISESRAVYNDETGKLELEETVEVYEVSEGGLMARLLEVGDILVSAELNGQAKTLTRQHQIIDLMVNARVGDEVHLTVLRDGDLINVVVVLTEECLIAY
ncbi:MAG: trypsin-like peptidase domain-containing protein [Oscillospiraceae bacterium]|nr:trypsin-like peptidase domain-containing protein [Oscillospiraceae bacterium]